MEKTLLSASTMTETAHGADHYPEYHCCPEEITMIEA